MAGDLGSGLKTSCMCWLNWSTSWALSLFGDIPKLDKSIGENAGFLGMGVNTDGASSDGEVVLDVLEISGVPLYELGLL